MSGFLPFLSRVVVPALLMLVIGMSQASAATLQQLLDDARASLEAGATERAWQLLSDAEPEYAGTPEFDYWLGLVAVRAGEPARASFALERVLAEQPNHAGARLELATAWVQLGRRDAAAEQLDRLEALDPPPQAQERIAMLNKELQRQERRSGERHYGGLLGLEGGHDDNVGTWPQGLEFFPGATVEAVESGFFGIKGAGWYRHDLAADRHLMFTLSGLARRNEDDQAEQFDQDYLSARGEWNRDLNGRDAVAAFAEAATLDLDGENYYRAWTLGGEWRRRQPDRRRFVAGLQLKQLDFDADEYDHLATRAHARMSFGPAPRWELKTGATLDYEAADNDRPGGDAVVVGLEAGALYQLTRRQRLQGDLGYARAEYRADYAPFEAITNATSEARSDDRLLASLSWEWLPGDQWQVRTQALWRDQDSTLEAYTYDQTTLSAGVSYFF